MSRREELEKEIVLIKKRMDDSPKDTPHAIVEQYTKELDSLSFELNNLYDDDENEFPS